MDNNNEQLNQNNEQVNNTNQGGVQLQPIEPKKGKSNNMILIILLVVILLVGAGLSYYFLIVKQQSNNTNNNGTTTTTTTTASIVDVTDLNIEKYNSIVNGEKYEPLVITDGSIKKIELNAECKQDKQTGQYDSNGYTIKYTCEVGENLTHIHYDINGSFMEIDSCDSDGCSNNNTTYYINDSGLLSIQEMRSGHFLFKYIDKDTLTIYLGYDVALSGYYTRSDYNDYINDDKDISEILVSAPPFIKDNILYFISTTSTDKGKCSINKYDLKSKSDESTIISEFDGCYSEEQYEF